MVTDCVAPRVAHDPDASVADVAYLTTLPTPALIKLALRYRALATTRALWRGEVVRRERIERLLLDRDLGRR